MNSIYSPSNVSELNLERVDGFLPLRSILHNTVGPVGKHSPSISIVFTQVVFGYCELGWLSRIVLETSFADTRSLSKYSRKVALDLSARLKSKLFASFNTVLRNLTGREAHKYSISMHKERDPRFLRVSLFGINRT